MSKHFYHHLIEIESLIVELDQLNLEDHQKIHLSKLVDSHLHQRILEVILDELSDDDKSLFIAYLKENDHGKIWQHLKSKILNVEEKIKVVSEDLKKELHKDIREAKNKK
ncbi:hypothetical protein HYS93_03130 [Candidatus Daviesbacteria bacterium]|nr:hypothetical protein [Candidatus Daviesbacteria bacterium]